MELYSYRADYITPGNSSLIIKLPNKLFRKLTIELHVIWLALQTPKSLTCQELLIYHVKTGFSSLQISHGNMSEYLRWWKYDLQNNIDGLKNGLSNGICKLDSQWLVY